MKHRSRAIRCKDLTARGCFLLSDKTRFAPPVFLLGAFTAWLLSALALCLLSALILNLSEGGERALSYTSSAISFLSAAAAGMAAARKHGKGSLYPALLTGSALSLLLLSLGFLISEKGLDPSAVLSVVSFSLAGSLFGGLLPLRPRKKVKKYTMKR